MPAPLPIPQPLPALAADWRPESPRAGEGYYEFLEAELADLDLAVGGHIFAGGPLRQRFGAGELIVPGYRRKEEPPRELWGAMVVPLALVMLARQCMAMVTDDPRLRVVATYRPRGGAARSTHKVNAAIDVSPLVKTASSMRTLMIAAAWVWRHHAHLRVGVGTYGASSERTALAHIDAGVRKRRVCWRQLGGDSVSPAVDKQGPAPWEAPT